MDPEMDDTASEVFFLYVLAKHLEWKLTSCKVLILVVLFAIRSNLLASPTSNQAPVTVRWNGSEFWDEPFPIPLRLHERNRLRLCERLRDVKNVGPRTFILLQGGKKRFRYSSDTEELFRQESYFHWAFGVREPDFVGLIEVDNGKATLFPPRPTGGQEMWTGKCKSNKEYKNIYQVDEVFYNDEIADVLASKNPSSLLTLEGSKTTSHLAVQEAFFEGIKVFTVDNKILLPEMDKCRVIKTDLEIDVLRYSCQVACKAQLEGSAACDKSGSCIPQDHRSLVMKRMRPGMKEYQLESIFKHYMYARGRCRYQSYILTVASGPNSSIMCYGNARLPNDRTICSDDICLVDCGFEYHCYTSDVTCCFPVSGVFSERQRIVYNTVLKANRAAMDLVKPGNSWVDMHLIAGRTVLEEFKKYGLVSGCLDQMMDLSLYTVFMPFGVGHFVGIDLLDVIGYPEEKINTPGLSSLESTCVLEEGMVLTVEPGVHFIEAVLQNAFKDPKYSVFLNKEVISQYLDFGGVRVEDCLAVTSEGYELLTDVPRSCEDIENIIAEGRNQELKPIV